MVKTKKDIVAILIIAISLVVITVSGIFGLQSVHDAGVEDGKEARMLQDQWDSYLSNPFYDYSTFKRFENYSIEYIDFGWRNQPEYNHHFMISCPETGFMIIYDITMGDEAMTVGTYIAENNTLIITRRDPWEYPDGHIMFPSNWQKINGG